MVDYPPLVLDELAPVGWLFGWLTGGSFRDSVLFTVLIKAEPVIFEAAFAALLFAVLLRTAGPSPARWAVVAYWLNPAALLDASVGGYLDALFVLPAAASLVAATSGWPAVAGGLIAASALTKPQGLFVVPAVLIALWNAGVPAERSRRLGLAAIGAAAVSALVVGPVVIAGAWWNMVYALRSQAAEVDVTMEGYNFWWIAGHFLWTAYAWQRGLRACRS
jgi:Gpi18-like mannosyltransferase